MFWLQVQMCPEDACSAKCQSAPGPEVCAMNNKTYSNKVRLTAYSLSFVWITEV